MQAMRSVYGVSHDLMNESRTTGQVLTDFTRLKSEFDSKRQFFEVHHPIIDSLLVVITGVGNFFEVQDPSSIIAGNIRNF